MDICIKRLRALAANPKLTPKEQSDLIRAIQGLQYTRTGGPHHGSVAEIFVPDRPTKEPVVAHSLKEARMMLGTDGES